MKCEKCIHWNACKAWIDHGMTLYDDFSYSIEDCPHYRAETNLDVEYARVAAEKEQYRRECAMCGEEIADLVADLDALTAALERVKVENAELDKAILNALHRMGEIRQEARAEVLAEYIERAKRRLPIISPSVFEQIAKEMLLCTKN